MAGERLRRILARFAQGDDGSAPGVDRLCRLCVSVSLVSGAGIMLMAGDVAAGSLCSSDAVSALIEDLQYTLGEGPCVDAYYQDRPVLEADLAHPVTPRWPAFSPAAVAGGAGAVFGFPLHVGAAGLGALNLYRDRPGPLGDDQYDDALVLAGLAARMVLSLQADGDADRLGVGLEEGANWRLVVHQAAGMVSAQLDVSVAEALIRLRAYAFRHDLALDDVAAAIVSRRLRLDHD